jgi:hypothetical protein
VVVPPVSSLVREMIDITRVVAFDKQLTAGARYERWQKHLSIETTVSTHKINCDDQAVGGATVAFPYPRYGVEFAKLNDDKTLAPAVERGTFSPAAGAKTANVTITLGSETDGWYLTQIVGYDAAGARVAGHGMKYWVVIDRNGQAKNSPLTVRQSSNYDWAHKPASNPAPAGKGWYSYVIYAKAAVTPQARPLPARDAVTPFATALTNASLARVALIPTTDSGDSDTHYPCVTNRGVLVSDNVQGYEPYHMFLKYPQIPDVDGPRGVCTTPFPLGLKGGRNGKVYGLSPHSLFVVDATGAKRTLAGITCVAPYYWEHAPTSPTDPRIKIVGDWDASVPADERWPHEAWAFDWDPRSLLLDNNAAPIGGEQPHLSYTAANGDVINGPRGFWVDSLNRLVEIQFNGSNRAAPGKCRVRLSGLSDPWGMAVSGNSVYISERKANRVSEYNIETWTKVRDVVSSPDASVVGFVQGLPRRRFRWNLGQSQTTARNYDCVAPESLVIRTIGGIRWLYVGSMAKGEVERIDLDNGTREHVAYPVMAVSGNGVDSYFLQIAVSDGSFGPAGSVFTTTFYNGPALGKPQAILPNGTPWPYNGGEVGYGVDMGAGRPWNGSHYALAVDCHEGRLFCSDSSGAINYFCKADAYDKPIDSAKARAGHEKWINEGHSAEHGPYAINRTTNPLPWGKDANLDYWMTNILRLT